METKDPCVDCKGTGRFNGSDNHWMYCPKCGGSGKGMDARRKKYVSELQSSIGKVVEEAVFRMFAEIESSRSHDV